MGIVYCIILVFYLILILLLSFGIRVIKPMPNISLTNPLTRFTILIPFRNEAHRIIPLLKSVLEINYPTSEFEIILINDNSTDDSIAVIDDYLKKSALYYTVINNRIDSNSPKKDALQIGIQAAQNDWIITTDADCVVSSLWLQTFHTAVITHNPKMIVGSVMFQKGKNQLDQFQYYDLLSLQGVTLGSFGMGFPFLCNGANLAYTKDFFIQLNGFENNEDSVSGDDVFLLQKAILKDKKAIHYLLHPQNTVSTPPEKSWGNTFQQRVRWAAKTSRYPLKSGKFIAIISFISNLLMVLSPICFYYNPEIVLAFLVLKIGVDLLFLKITAQHLKIPTRVLDILINSFIYPLFSTAVALYSLFGFFVWKERQFKR